MDTARFVVELTGKNVRPETTRGRDLAEFVIDLEKAILAVASTRDPGESEGAAVSLVAIEDGSNRLTISIAASAVWAASALSLAIKTNDYQAISAEAHGALHALSQQAERKEWAVRFIASQALKIEDAVISRDHPVPCPPDQPQASGTTTITGRCVRVGGAGSPRAEIRLAGGGLLHIDVTECLARQLAKNLYDEVCIEGQATWRTVDWHILDFRATRVTDFRTTDPLAAFEQLAKAANGRWDGVDADAYVRELREDVGPR